MKTSMLLLLLVFGFPRLVLGETIAELSVSYDSAGLNHIEIRDGMLQNTWQTLRMAQDKEHFVLPRQDLSGYDSHQITMRLTPLELRQLQQWVEDSGLSRFHSPFPQKYSDHITFGGGFKTHLKVSKGAAEYELEWTGDSAVPQELLNAVTELNSICHEIAEHHMETREQ